MTSLDNQTSVYRDLTLLPLSALTAGATAFLIQHKVFTLKPVYASVNLLVCVTLVVFGVYLILRKNQVFSGSAFAASGFIWILTVPVDKLGGYWPFWSYIATGFFFVAFGWAGARYDIPRLQGPARFLPVVGTASTAGLSCLLALFTAPESLGYPPDTPWITVFTNSTLSRATAVASILCWAVYAGYFIYICRVRLRQSSPTSRSAFAPLAIASSTFGVTTVLIIGFASLFPSVLDLDASYTVTGLVALVVMAGLVATLVRQQLLYGRLVRGLPNSLSHPDCEEYLAGVLGDTDLRVLAWSEEDQIFVNSRGFPVRSEEASDALIKVADEVGTPVLYVVASEHAVSDSSTRAAAERIAELIAKNIQLNALLQQRIRQLNLARRSGAIARERGAELLKRDLHDGVQQTVIAARLDIEGLEETLTDAAAISMIRSISERLGVAVEEIRALSRGLVESTRNRNGFEASIQQTGKELRLELTVAVNGKVPQILEAPLLYCVREALVNVHKHADTDSANVSVIANQSEVVLTVLDCGAGGAEERAAGGGLKGLRSRVTDLGGRLEVVSTIDVGTRLEAHVPCG